MDGERTEMMTSEDVRKEIENLLQNRFDVPEDFASGGEYDDFFSLEGLLVPRELTYLAYMLEQRYGIQFCMKEYDDPRFYSLSGLSEIIADMINRQSIQEVNT